MSLPVSQQRKLDLIEGQLRASSPHLASMLFIFTRLSNDDGPALTERLAPSRLRAVRNRLRTFVPIPLAIAMAVAGVVLASSGPAPAASHQQPLDRVTQLVVPGK